ncbi:hypothetical protein KAU43_09275, partial [candidate division WOR-3 bacterium]|nr:hypothetical protein [candidate division WOR-3 bacterium]
FALITRIGDKLHEGEEGKYILLLLHEFDTNYTKRKGQTQGSAPTINGLRFTIYELVTYHLILVTGIYLYLSAIYFL